MTGSLVRYIHEDGFFKAAVVESTAVGQAAFARLAMPPTATYLLTKVMTGALLLASNIKSEGTLLLKLEGASSETLVQAEANTLGEVRGTASGIDDSFQPGDRGLFQRNLYPGRLSQVRRTRNQPKAYTSVVDLVPGELAQNLAHYLLQSEQIPSAVQLGANLDEARGIAGAGGILLQAMPGAPDPLRIILEDRIANMPALGELFNAGLGHERIADRLFDGMPFKRLSSTDVRFHCRCSRKRMMKVIASLPEDELRAMRQENKAQTITCSFCNRTYTCQPTDLDAMIEAKRGYATD